MNMNRHSIMLMMVSLSFCLICHLTAGTTGKLAGKVIDEGSGEPLPGVNILLEETTLGASADEDGQFFILNIPPGIYTIQAVYVGYTTKIVKNVEINVDRTTSLDISMEETVLEQSESIVVVAEKEMIHKDNTGSIAIVGAPDIQAMPVQSINDVLNLQAGVIQSDDGIHVRGGRARETMYMVDGVSVTNLNGDRRVDIETDAVQEMQLISGTFNAEYGNAMSGIVNIITKEGGSDYAGQLQALVGSYYSTSNTYSVMETYGPGIDPGTGKTVIVARSNKPLESFKPNYDVRGTLSGPLPFLADMFHFFVSGRYYNDNGYLYGRNWYTPQGLAGDSALVPLRYSENFSVQGKLTFQPSSSVKIAYSAFYNNYSLDHNTSTLYRYVPESGRQQFDRGITQTLAINHTISGKTFYDMKFSHFYADFESYLYEDPTLTPNYLISITKTIDGEEVTELVPYATNAEKDALVAEAKENGWNYDFVIDPSHAIGYIDPEESGKSPASMSFRDKYTPHDYNYNQDKFILGKFDLTSQVSQHHLVKTGVAATFHGIKREGFTLRPATGPDGNVLVPFEPRVEPTSSIFHNVYERNPVEFSAYVQDKMEFDQLIVNVGLRFDYFDPDYIVPVDPTDPDIYHPVNPAWKGPDWDEAYYTSLPSDAERKAYAAAHSYSPEERRALMQKEVTPKTQFSPRIGVAYPISANGVIHVSYGHFFQMPQARYLYGDAGSVRPDYKLSLGTDDNLFGNADLNAESTVQYEIGLQAQVYRGLGVDLTVFYKDIRDWVGISPRIDTKHAQTTAYIQYENKDYANVRGITLAVEARPTTTFTAMLDYTYQIAEGTYTSPNDAYAALQSNNEPAVKLIYMDYDRRHSVNGVLTYHDAGWVVSMIGIYNTGFPYTPQAIAGTPEANYRGWRENIARRPSYSQIDLRIDKEIFRTGSVSHQLFLRVFNLFDQRGELNVHPDTGTAQFTTYGTHNWVVYNPNRIGSLEHYYLNPEWYQQPREIQLGYILNF